MVPRPSPHDPTSAGRTRRCDAFALSRATTARSGPTVPPHTACGPTTPSSTDLDEHNYDGRACPTIHDARRPLPAPATGRGTHTRRCRAHRTTRTHRGVRSTAARIFARHNIGSRRGSVLPCAQVGPGGSHRTGTAAT